MSLKEFLPQQPTVFKLKAKKCNLFQPSARYLERIVTADGYTMDPADVAAVLALKEAKPSTFGALRKLLGIINYYRHNIKDFSRLAKPLYDILSCSDVPKATSTKTRGAAKEDRYPQIIQSPGLTITRQG